jgi:hypothetical protein
VHRRSVAAFGFAGAVLIALIGVAGQSRADCRSECRDANCGTSPQEVFTNCRDNCEELDPTLNCKVIGLCFSRCEAKRAAVAAQCSRDVEACTRQCCKGLRCCIRGTCSSVTTAAAVEPSPSVTSFSCLRACARERAACQLSVRPLRLANRHCKAHCAEDCRSYARFPRILGLCRDHCDTLYDPTTSGRCTAAGTPFTCCTDSGTATDGCTDCADVYQQCVALRGCR